ncbi:family 78 glycoside hydrolase catalytic domain [Formosa undariae]|uniref:alpha-L-rhamnosidase n=1 Tax=Formosa undariae TaxID=1325436 RepID=A0ABV5F5U9_9FLAO
MKLSPKLIGVLMLCGLTFTVFSCQNLSSKKTVKNSPEVSTTGFNLDNASWITYERPLPEKDSLFYLNHPAPIFRKEFNSKESIKKATLYITAAGYYEATINGERIGKNILDPAWTDFSKRIFVSEYDITSQINENENCLGVTLGNGFYNPLPLRKWGRRNLRTDLTVGKPTVIAKLIIEYTNGETEEIATDDTWKYSYGAIQKNSVYIGVAYDATKEINGWKTNGFDDSKWSTAIIDNGPGGDLQKAFFPPVQITKTLTPTAITSPEKEVYIVDMGVNFTGTFKMKMTGKKGDTINYRFGERIYDDGSLNPMTTVIGQIKRKGAGGPGAPDIAWQTDSYVMGDSEAWFQPPFTYHVYRYIEISGLKEKPKTEDIQGLMFHTNVENENTFSSSSDLLNSIQEISERSFLTNLISVQSDCAAREKFGYGGDLNATSEAYINNFDMKGIYRKTVYDWVDAMKDSTFVDTAPFTGVEYCGISWESAYLTTQYYLYLYYNDTDFVKEMYEKNNKWMDKVARIHPDGMVNKGLSDHESLLPVPVQLIGTSHYMQCAEIMETFAKVMNDKDNELKYRQLADHLRTLVKNEFWDKPVKTKINRQTLFSTLLYHNIVPTEELEAAKDSLQNAINNGPSGHLNTGIFGTKYALEAVSKNISPDTVFDIVNSKAYPGWGFMVANGATTIWETWKESEGTFSNNHPMFGSVSEWFYRWLGGIQPDPKHPGFKKFILTPSTPEGLEFVNTKYNSPFGTIVSNWKKLTSTSYEYTFAIPSESSAQVNLTLNPSQDIKILKDGEVFNQETKSGQFDLEAGNYKIVIADK